MSTFYLLPPRSVVAAHFADFLQSMMPGTDWSETDLADAMEALLADHFDVYVAWREDLPAGGDVQSTLMELYGAEDGDEVIEVRATGRAGSWATLRWPILADWKGVA